MSAIEERIFNFSAGPSTLPVEVLQKAQADLINFQGTGMSVMEMSHRSKPFEAIIQGAESNLRKLMGIPDDYSVLFLQGGASLQFTMVPMNFVKEDRPAGYILTGTWGSKAVAEAKLEGHAVEIFSEKAGGYRRAPKWDEIHVDSPLAYLHFTTNETIHGVQFHADPPKFSAPMVCDMSSDILSRPVDVSKYDFIYAGAQKNMGPAGAVVVIVKKSFLEQQNEGLPPMLSYHTQDLAASLYNTPPCWSIYVCGLVYEHVLATGGVEAAHKRNSGKAKTLYDAVDSSNGFFKGHANADSRSLMNVTFTLPSDELTDAFLKECSSAKLSGLKGHRSVGGCRASIYNAFPQAGCDRLASLMEDFRKAH